MHLFKCKAECDLLTLLVFEKSFRPYASEKRLECCTVSCVSKCTEEYIFILASMFLREWEKRHFACVRIFLFFFCNRYFDINDLRVERLVVDCEKLKANQFEEEPINKYAFW